jgi:Zinc finger, C3HC4 type (RING finger)
MTRRSSLIPAGFECTAHSCFFDDSNTQAQLLTFSNKRLSVSDDCTGVAEHKHSASSSRQQEHVFPFAEEVLPLLVKRVREVDTTCPICLSPFDDAVTLTSCLHTFCHGCLVAWLGHVRAAAAAAAAIDELAAAARLECPLCKAACRHFLSVEPSSDSSSSSSSSNSGRSPFRLYGVTESSSSGSSSSGSSSSNSDAEHSRRGGKRRRGSASESPTDSSDLPSMQQLRAAVCTQRAVALAASTQRDLKQHEASSGSSTSLPAEAESQQQQQQHAANLVQKAAKTSAVKPKAVRAAPLWQAGTLSAREALAEIQALLQQEQAALAALEQQQLQYSS